MIDIRELRIGSYIESVHPDFKIGYFKVWAINPSGKSFKIELDSEILDSHIQNVPLDYVNPIPLTEDILSHCPDFRKDKNQEDETTYHVMKSIWEVKWTIEHWTNESAGEYKGSFFIQGLGIIKYLHELQNIYLLKEKKELEVKI